MGERWTIIRDSLGEDPPGVIAWLRKQLHSLGPFFDPIRSGPPHTRLPYFADAYDSAIVALMQASSLCEQRDFVARAVRAGANCLETDNKGTALMHVGEYAIGIERLLAAFAWRIDPQLHGETTLTDSLKALNKQGLLPLTDDELALWDADRRWVEGEVAERRKQGEKGPSGKVYARLWQRRFEVRLGDSSAPRAYPRYLALVELLRLRNAYAHRRSSGLLGFSRPDQVWRRITALLAMICVRAFARGILAPPPTPEIGAVTISRSPPAVIPTPDPEPLVAYASIEIASEPATRVGRKRRRQRRPKERGRAGEPAVRRPRKGAKEGRPGRKWLLLTGAATTAVLLGTLGANVLAPRAVVPAPGSPGEAVGELVAPEADADRADSPEVERSGSPEIDVPALALSGPTVPPANPRRPSTARCTVARGSRGRAVGLPALRVAEPHARDPRFGTAHEASRIGAFLQSNRNLGAVVFLETVDLGDPEALLRQLEATVCDLRPVLDPDEALKQGALPDDALVVATFRAADDPQLGRLVDLAGTGRSPRLLAAVPELPEDLPAAYSVVRPEPYDCERARDALLSAIPRNDASNRIGRWKLLMGRDDAVGCKPPPILRSLRGVRVAAAALAAHEAPPMRSPGSWPWTEWVAQGAAGGLPLPPKDELALRSRALELAHGRDLDVGKVRRRRLCRQWADEHGDELKELALLRHVAGTEPGRQCLLWLIEGGVRATRSNRRVFEELALGLGTGRLSDVAVEHARGDARAPGVWTTPRAQDVLHLFDGQRR